MFLHLSTQTRFNIVFTVKTSSKTKIFSILSGFSVKYQQKNRHYLKKTT